MKYFWRWRPDEGFPPKALVRPEELSGLERLNVACTQTGLPAQEQKRVVTEWCEVLPSLGDVRLLWFASRVPQRLFEAACQMPGLEGLYIKWSGIDDLSALHRLKRLRYFHLGQSARIDSIDPLAGMSHLQWLGLELPSRVRDLDAIGDLVGLEGLSCEGSMGTTWRVRTLDPLGKLHGLRWLSIANVRSDSGTLSPLFSLTNLETFIHASWWSQPELDEIRARNPRLAA